MGNFLYFALIFLIFSITTAQGIKCYKCDSSVNTNCNDVENWFHPEECTNGEVSCITRLGSIKYSIVRECKKKHTECTGIGCRECHENGCNTHIGCFECGSDGPACSNSVYNTTICPHGKDKCMTSIKDDRSLEHKCVSNTTYCVKKKAKPCHISNRSFKNFPFNPFPFNRLVCYQCRGGKECNDVKNQFPQMCKYFDEHDRCYTIGTSEMNITRGCMSDIDHKCFGETCVTCKHNSCNAQSYYRQRSLYCFQCGPNEKNCSMEGMLCKNPVEYWKKKEKCYIQLVNGKTVQGCVYDRGLHEPPCTPENKCEKCDTDDCNIFDYDYSDQDEDTTAQIENIGNDCYYERNLWLLFILLIFTFRF